MTLREWALTALAGLLLVDPGAAAPQVQAPLPCMHPEMRPLEFLRGGWNVTGSWLGPSGAMDPVVGRSEVSSELGGCLMAERFKGTMKGEPFESLTLFAYDPAGKRHELVHSDSLHGSLVTFTGSAVPDGFAFEAEIQLSRTITLRQEYRRAGEAVVVERKRRFDGGDAWTTVWRATYQKTR